MRSYLLTILFLFLLFGAWGQEKQRLDSLTNVLKKLPAEGRSFAGDTMRVRVLCEMGETDDNIEVSQKYISQAILLSKKINFNKGQIQALLIKAKKVLQNENNLKAGEIFYECLLLSEETNDSIQIGNSLLGLGKVYREQSKLDSSIFFLERAYNIFSKLNYKLGIIKSINGIGSSYMEQNNSKKALFYYSKGLEINKNDTKNGLQNAYLLGNMGIVYSIMGDLKKAQSLVETSINILLNYKSETDLDLLPPYIELAHIHYLKKEYSKSISIANKALDLSKRKSQSMEYHVHKVLYRNYKALNDNKKALYHIELYKSMEDSLQKLENAKKVNLLRNAYESEKKQFEIEYLNKDIEIKNTQRFVLLGGIILFVVFSIFLWKSNRILNDKNILIEEQKQELTNIKNSLEDINENLELKVQARTLELKKAYEEIKDAMLKGQTLERKRVAAELHDNLGGTLSALKWRLTAIDVHNLSSKEKSIYEGIVKMMNDAYKDVRNISHHLLPEILEKNGLVLALNEFIDEINTNNQTSFIFDSNVINLNVNKKIEFELYSTCLELINNIIKHANATEAQLLIEKNKDFISVMVWDNGLGMNIDKDNKGKGLINIENRLKTINGNYQLITSENNGTKYKIMINLTENEMLQV